jgi:transcriptional regulator with XRE-family HTH domain
MGPEDRDDEPAYPEALGRTIRVYRAARDMGRRELAEQAEVSYSYLAEIEKGAKYPSTKALHAIAKALGLSPAELLTASETLEAPEELAPTESLEDRSPDREASTLAATFGLRPGGARARQRLWFDTELPALTAKRSRKPAQQDLRLDHDWEPQLDRLLAELRALLREMLPEDRQHVLELARRLAKR